MSRPDDLQTDDGLDAALGALGLPAEAAPYTSAADIAARAASLAPAATGLMGWRLAAVVIGVGLVGFGGGLLVRGLLGSRPEQVEQVAAAPALEAEKAKGPDQENEIRDSLQETNARAAGLAAAQEGSGAPGASGASGASGESGESGESGASASGLKTAAASRGSARAAPRAASVAAHRSPEPGIAAPVAPEPGPPEPSGEAVAAAPLAPDPAAAPPAPEDPASDALALEEPEPESLDEDDPGELDLSDFSRRASKPPSRAHLALDLAGRGVLDASLPDDQPNAGIGADATWTVRTADPLGPSPFVGVGLNLTLLAGRGHYRPGASVEALGGYSWEQGTRRFDLGLAVSGTALARSRALGPPEALAPGATVSTEPGSLQLLAGPALALSIGPSAVPRLHLGGELQLPLLGPGAESKGTWLGFSLGVDIPTRRRQG